MGNSDTIERILDIEVMMFRRVRTDEEPSCRAHLDDMRLHRRGQLMAWSEETRASYLRDLEEATAAGRNLMTLKYARMDNLIPPLKNNPLLDRICDQFILWQREVISRYPNTMRTARSIDDFANYLRSEIETYSDETLTHLWHDVRSAVSEQNNLSASVYEALARQAGYDSLSSMEQKLAGG